MNPFDVALFHALAAGSTPNAWLLPLMQLLATTGAWASAALAAWALIDRRADRLYVLGALAACAGAAVLSHAIAEQLGFARPFMLNLSPAYIPHGARGSMPSSHASVMLTLAFAFIARRGLRVLGGAALAVALATAWARIYVGVHFPLDIAGGGALALALLLLLRGAWALGTRLARAARHGRRRRSRAAW